MNSVPLDRYLSRFRPSLLDLACCVPTPTLCVDLAALEGNFRSFQETFPGVDPFYAVKANPSPDLVRRLVSAGCRFDVASVPEMQLVLGLGGCPADLSYGNPVKSAADIAAAHDAGVTMFAFDSASELDKLSRFAPGSLVFARLACSGAGSMVPLAGKFGTSESHAADLLALAVSRGHRVGLSFHTGSQQLDPCAWLPPLAACRSISSRLADLGAELDLLNVGGGFPSPYLALEPPPLADFADTILPELKGIAARVIAEPGRLFVADTAVFATTVSAVTHRPDAGTWVYLDTGVFGGFAETIGEQIRYPIVVVGADNDDLAPVTIAGPTCDSLDVLYAQHLLARSVGDGDRVLILNTGSYTASYASVSFNGFAPPTVRFVH